MLGSQSGGRVPVTAKLSRKFYERFGDDITTELVDWFNAVDETYRNQLKELNELNWERFKADNAATRAELRGELREGLAQVRKEIADYRGDLRDAMGAMRADLHKWVVIYLSGFLLSLGGLIAGIETVFRH